MNAGDALSNVDLERHLKNIPGFAGVFTKSTLPDDLKGKTSLIVNACDAPGCHWLAMRFDSPAGGEYFDSYGLPPDGGDDILRSKTHFAAYMAKHSRGGRYTVNRRDLQSIGTAVCGDYSAFFIEHGSIEDNPRAWAPILAQRTSLGRDRMVRKLAGVVRNKNIGHEQRGVELVERGTVWSLERR